MSGRRSTISTLAKISSGKRPPSISKDRDRLHPVPVIGGGGPSGYTTKSSEDAGVMVTGRVGTLGKLHIASEPCWPSDNALVLKPVSDDVDALFLRYAVSEVIALAVGFNRGAANPLLTQKDLGRLEIAVFPLAEQRQIAATLGALDDKIELNRKMAATLEGMARALYRSWFVDFDPVRARAEGRPPAHMDPTTAALFPDSFGEDGLPVGWEVSTIGEIAEIVGGSTPSTKESNFWVGGEHAWATPRDLSSLGQVYLFDTERKVTTAGLAKITSALSPAGTLLLSSRAPIGYLAVAAMPIAVNQGFIAVRETANISGIEAYFWCAENMNLIHANANGSTFQEISKKNFRPLEYLLASASVRAAFSEQAGSWFDRIKALSAENYALATIRDTLLPRLMSGDLRVGAAREMIEEAS